MEINFNFNPKTEVRNNPYKKILSIFLVALACSACNKEPTINKQVETMAQTATPAQTATLTPPTTQDRLERGRNIIVQRDDFRSLSQETKASNIKILQGYSVQQSTQEQPDFVNLTEEEKEIIQKKLAEPSGLAYYYEENNKSFYFFERNNATKTVDYLRFISVKSEDLPKNFSSALLKEANVAISFDNQIAQFLKLQIK